MSATTRKVPAKIWRDILTKLDGRIEAACLRRDAYLSKVIGVEVEILDKDVTLPNSKQASKFISERLDHLDRKLVSFTLDTTIADRLNEVCAAKGIVRDAFFNRLIFWLVASPKVINRILGSDWDSEVWKKHEWDIGIHQAGLYPLDESFIKGIFVDPLWAVHEYYKLQRDLELSVDSETGVEGGELGADRSSGVESRRGFYTCVLRDNFFKNVDLWGLNTYLPDYEVPGRLAHKELVGEWEVLPPS